MVTKLIVTSGKSAGRSIAIKRNKLLIGRSEECDVRPLSEEVSRRHCAVHVGPAARHAGLLDLSPEANLDVRSLAEAWLTRVARAGAATAVPQGTGFRSPREADIAAIAARFRDARWITRR